ncbi:hypothetical protein HF669_10855 [Acidithiobacillus thiooxidans]|uniref:hypothetical protein n=1 Tax=Acidithiobacillus thiooxidans TaxID=930 RepID=UPI0002624F54|nr:hypothetical protein [Acidithiobacillus thiooxidans]MBU2811852.1 hypothetical protein [Acidithiobacillus thiooxidans]
MPAKILLLLVLASLAGCATITPSGPNHLTSSAATQSAQLAQQKAELAERHLAAIAGQRATAERQFCPNWQQALLHARNNAIGCAQIPINAQSACWQAVAQWTNEESQYFHALHPLFTHSPYAEPAGHAAHFFDLAQSWAMTCEDGGAACTQASGHQQMDQEKKQVNQFCMHQ